MLVGLSRTFVCSCVLLWGLASSIRDPSFNRRPLGSIQIDIPDLSSPPVCTSVQIEVKPYTGSRFEPWISQAQLMAGGYWRTVLPRSYCCGEVQYTVTYNEKGGQVVKHNGSITLVDYSSSFEVLNPPHHLRRRAHTVFYDDFSSGHVDSSKWTQDVSADGVGNHEFQMYTPDTRNTFVKHNHLYIKPSLTSDKYGEDFIAHGTFDARKEYGRCDNNFCFAHGWGQIHPVMSGLMRSTANIKYGRVEVVAQLPKGDWLWPAIWMMPRGQDYGWWPKSGEIDIMEACGNTQMYYSNGQTAGIQVDRSTIHYGPNPASHKQHGETYRLPHGTFGDGFHTYWLDWTEQHIIIGVDDHTVLHHNTPSHGYWQEGGWGGDNIWKNGAWNAPYDKEFYLILNVAVGGDFFWDGYTNKPYDKPWSSGDNDKMMYFYNARNQWLPTWHGDDVALRVKSVKMTQY